MYEIFQVLKCSAFLLEIFNSQNSIKIYKTCKISIHGLNRQHIFFYIEGMYEIFLWMMIANLTSITKLTQKNTAPQLRLKFEEKKEKKKYCQQLATQGLHHPRVMMMMMMMMM